MINVNLLYHMEFAFAPSVSIWFDSESP